MVNNDNEEYGIQWLGVAKYCLKYFLKQIQHPNWFSALFLLFLR